MLQIVPLTDQNAIKSAFVKRSLPYYEQCKIISSTERGNITGSVFFGLADNSVDIYLLVPEGIEQSLADGLIRAALNYGYMRGIAAAHAGSDALAELFCELGLMQPGENLIDIRELFEKKSCNHGKQ